MLFIYKKALVSFLFLIALQEAKAQVKYTVGPHLFSRSTIYPLYERSYNNNSNSKHLFLYGAGVSLFIFPGERYFLETGASYSNKIIKLDNEPDTRFLVNQQGIPEAVIVVGKRDVKTSYQFLSLPLIVNYPLFKRVDRTNIMLSGGVIFDFLFRARSVMYSSFDGKHESLFARGLAEGKVDKVIQAGIGVMQPIGKQYLLVAKPSLNYVIVVNQLERTDNYRTFGLSLQFHYKFPQTTHHK